MSFRLLVGGFKRAYLEEYIKAYWLVALIMPFEYRSEYSHRSSWSAAIVLIVNISIFPITSEKELRRTLILSLEHVATFTHLLAKVI